MRYVTLHQGKFWFQIRVPAALHTRLGEVIRANLNTADARTAKLRALQLAAQWHQTFVTMRLGDLGPVSIPSPVPSPLETLGLGAGNLGAVPRQAPEAPSHGVSPGAPSSLTALCEYWRTLAPDRPPRTVIEFEATAEDFDHRISLPIAEVTRRDVASYRDLLLGEGLSPATVTKRIGFVSALLQTATDAGQLSANVARGLRTPRCKVESLGRRAFAAEDLHRIFASPVYSQRLRPRAGGGEAAAWIPLLAYGTGARLNELAQLRPADIQLDSADGPVIHICDNDPGKRLKTASSRRLVPVHPELVRAGFACYVRRQQTARSEWLFPSLVSDRFGSRGANWGRWFGRYLRQDEGCGVPDPLLVFHSFRHLFKQLCRQARIPEEVHDALTGHSGESGHVGRRYGGVPIPVLVQAVASITFPVAMPVVVVEE